ncbi:hypothetical protein D3C80_2021240 [compost metagenome]
MSLTSNTWVSGESTPAAVNASLIQPTTKVPSATENRLSSSIEKPMTVERMRTGTAP